MSGDDLSRLLSMTGYGTALRTEGSTTASVEVRTVNHRSLDIHIRLPRDLGSLEPGIQESVRERVARGRVDVTVTVETVTAPRVTVNIEAARAYLEAARSLQETFALEDNIGLRTLITLPGVIETRDSGAAFGAVDSVVAEVVTGTVREALDSALVMRGREGSALAAELRGHLANLSASIAAIRSLLPRAAEVYRQRLGERLAQLLPGSGIDPQRAAQEVAVLAEKADIAEEVARLESHGAQFGEVLEDGREVGRKLDFLLQEMQREANTVLSKSCSLEITRVGLAMRADIERLREQVQNVE